MAMVMASENEVKGEESVSKLLNILRDVLPFRFGTCKKS